MNTSQPMNTSLYFVHATSPLHVGVGEGVGAINLPIARERMSGYPYLPGSSIKGVLREAGEQKTSKDDAAVLAAFGPPTERAADARGGLVFSDASLLCLPVRSLLGTFAWVTAPAVLARLRRDAAEAGQSIDGLDGLAHAIGAKALVTKESALLLPGEKAGGPRLYLEEIAIREHEVSDKATACAAWLSLRLWPEQQGTAGDLAARARQFFTRRFLVVEDDVFNFLCRTATEVRSRVKIDDETGTAAASGPWQEEALPAETLLFGLIIARPTRVFRITRDDKGNIRRREEDERGEARSAEQAMAALRGLLPASSALRFGGKSSVGLGRARLQVVFP